MLDTKYILFSKEGIAPVAIVTQLPDHLDPYLVVPYETDWGENAQLVLILTKLGTKAATSPLEVLHDVQLDQISDNAKLRVSLPEIIDVTGFDHYATEGLNRLIHDLDAGQQQTETVQPHENFEYNQTLYQWAVVPV